MGKGVAVDKPIYNHITGELDPDEHVEPTPIVIFEGLHPMYDERVNEALDLTIYLDITDSVKFAWKAQRDMAERGASMEDVQAAIDARKPDFAAYVEPQKAKADIIIQVLMSDLIEDESGKFLKVKYIQKKSVSCVSQPYLFDEGSKVCWTPNSAKLTSTDGVALASSRWTARLTRLRRSSTSSRLSPDQEPNSTVSSLSRWSRIRTRRVRRTAPGFSRRSPPSRSAKLLSRLLLKTDQT